MSQQRAASRRAALFKMPAGSAGSSTEVSRCTSPFLLVAQQWTAIACATCGNTAQQTSLKADELKSFDEVSNTSGNENKATVLSRCELIKPRTVRSSGIALSVWRRLGIFLYQRDWQADRLRPFGVLLMLQVSSRTPFPYGRTAGSAVVTGRLVSPSRATAGIAVAVGGGSGGEGVGSTLGQRVHGERITFSTHIPFPCTASYLHNTSFSH
ncbi:hypothetical protein Q8A73_023189 [Channa argus]|nr:hypothetical protein Q8A73_023189 [Channa argus]